MDFDLARLLTTEYFFDRNPGGEFMLGYGLLVFFIAIIFAKDIIKKFAPDNKYFKKSIKKRLGEFVFLGILGVVLVASRFSHVPVFSMRFLLYIVFLLTIGLGLWTWVRIKKEYKKRISSVNREKEKKEVL